MNISAPSAMTELEAVNAILALIGEAPLNTLADVTSLDAISAVSELRKAMRETLQDPFWFNTETVTLSPTIDGELIVPSSYLSVQATDLMLHYTQRGHRLYNLETNSYTGNSSGLEVFAIVSLSWDELPTQARWYIQARAARTFSQSQIGEKSLYQAAALEERAALADLHNENIRQLSLSRLDNPAIARGFRSWR